LPTDAYNLKLLARNLHVLLARVPHGEKKKVLARAGFAGGDPETADSYRHNVTLPPDMHEVPEGRWRRLSTRVEAYISVAEACPPFGDAAIQQLLRGTLWEAKFRGASAGEGWMQQLSAAIIRVADDVTARTQLGDLFDKMSAANLCMREGSQCEFGVTGWLSVTFHKTDAVQKQHETVKPYWLLDREDEGAPLGGVAVFSPKVELERSEIRIALKGLSREEPEEHFFGDATLVVTCSLYLALLPSATDLDAPCMVEPAILQRPSLRLVSDHIDLPVQHVKREKGRLRLFGQEYPSYSLHVFHAGVDADDWLSKLSLSDYLFELSPHGSKSRSVIDLAVEAWRVVPFGCEACEAALAAEPSKLCFAPPAPPAFIKTKLLHDMVEIDEIDLQAIDPDRFAPQGSIASALQRSLGPTGPIAQALEENTISYRQAYDVVVNAARALLDDAVQGERMQNDP
jgi:hypothetical protein